MRHCTGVQGIVSALAYADAPGATMTSDVVEDHGMRIYRARDLRGHRSAFAKELA